MKSVLLVKEASFFPVAVVTVSVAGTAMPLSSLRNQPSSHVSGTREGKTCGVIVWPPFVLQGVKPPS